MSSASPMVLELDEATAARRRMLFHMTVTADGSDATGLTLAGADVTISKNGAAFGNAAGAVTELANGWYQLEFAAADLDTVGALAVRIGEALVDFALVQHQVVAYDPYAALATAAAVAALQTSVNDVLVGVQPVRTTNHVLGNLTEDGSTDGLSMTHAVDGVVTVSGTFDSATVTIETTADTTADPIAWATYVDAAGDNPLTADGEIIIAGPVQGIRATMSNDGASSDVDVTLQIRTNQP